MRVMEELISIDAIERFIANHRLSFLYVSRQDCSVCHAILPKLRELLERFPSISLGHIQAETVGEIASKYLIFTAPTLLFFIEGKEMLREDRFVQFGVLERKLENLIELLK